MAERSTVEGAVQSLFFQNEDNGYTVLSLLTDDGPYSELLQFFRNYEYANWDEITKFSRKYGISGDTINEAYINSVKWCNDLIEASS